MTDSSYRTILRSSSIIGGAQVINIAVGLARMKVVALLLGPMGVGLVGLYLNIVQTASGISALGLNNVGTRQIAIAHSEGGEIALGRTRRALFWGTIILAIIGATAFWMASGWIARVILGDQTRTDEISWLSLAVALTVAAGSQGALLTGLRRISDLARITIGAGIASATLGLFAVWTLGSKGIVVMVVVVPATSFLLGHVYVARLPPPAGRKIHWSELSTEWRILVQLGFAFMISGVVATLGQLAARALVQRELGLDALGHFQASWAIGMTYLGFVLGAMATDYYPRLTAAIKDPVIAVRLVNEQTEVALLLCAPPLLAMLGFAPWVVQLLYSSDFAPAVEILRWQLMGDVLKVMSWPLGFVLISSGAGKTFIATESFGMAVFVVGVAVSLPLLGVTATGVAFLALYAAYLPLVRWLAGRKIGFRWTKEVKIQALAIVIAAVAVDVAGRWSNPMGAALGAILAAGMTLGALVRLSTMTAAEGKLGRIAKFGEKWTSSVRRSR